MIYVSTPALASSSRLSTMQTQSELATIGQELSSGRLADAGLSLGSRSGQLVQVDAERTRLKGQQTVNSQAATRLTATASALTSLQTTAQSMLSALTAATASGTGNATGLKATAQAALSQLTATLNTAVGGAYIFGGINTGEQPLAAYTAGSDSKAAVDAAFQNAFGTSQTSAGAAAVGGDAMTSFLDGSFGALFDASGYGATWSSASDEAMTNEIAPNDTVASSVSANSSAFRQLAQAYTAISEFTGGSFSSAATSAAVVKATSLVTSALSSLTTVQAGVGLTQKAISTANTNLDSQISLLGSQSESLDGIDAYALTTRLSALQTQLQASYELTAKLHSMSLTQYLS